MSTTQARAQCSRCEMSLLLVDGKVEKHTHQDPFARSTCPGSGQSPRRAAEHQARLAAEPKETP